ncbi:MAG: DNA polymerase I, partial [Candidatus Omnitrophica bacterium]|nr:DNA polymerase I [Candidatus Omnitrophota bacterium]
MVDLMALVGDASDNIPGVRGIGQVSAVKLLNEFGTLENIYKKIDKVPSGSMKTKLEDSKDMAEMSFELARLRKNVPVKLDLKKTEVTAPDLDRLVELYGEFEFNKLLREIMPKEKESSRYLVKEDAKALKEFFSAISDKKEVSFSVDADSGSGEVFGVAFSLKEGEAFYVPVNAKGQTLKENLRLVKDLLEDDSIKKKGHDLKDDVLLLKAGGIDIKGLDFDVMIADYLIDPSLTRHDLPEMAMRHIGCNLSEDKDGVKWDDAGQGSLDLSGGPRHEGACERADFIFRLYGILEPQLKEKHLSALFKDVEMPLVGVLADMEAEGVGVNIKYLKERSSDIEKKLHSLTKKIYKSAGEEFNINSPKQLQVILYEKLGLPAMKKTKTGVSTDESVLRKLTSYHELPASLLEYREVNKLKTGYYDSILELVNKKNHKLHANFNQAVTATGRLSSSEPNLQNIPIKTELGREIRRAFIPSEKGDLLLAADYSQVELRILAHLSNDKRLLKAFAEGEDVHRYTASQIYDCDIDKVTDEMRSVAKTVNFGIAYGMSPFGLAKDLDISVEDAHKFIGAYFRRYSDVSTFIDDTISSVRKKGYVTTLLKRRRYIPEINSKNERIKSFAERVAVNTPVQGSAADLIKLAMIECHKRFTGTDVKMTIQVHDELVFEVPKNKLKDTASEVRKIMENVISLKVPLVVDVKAGENWLDMKEVA